MMKVCKSEKLIFIFECSSLASNNPSELFEEIKNEIANKLTSNESDYFYIKHLDINITHPAIE